MEDGLISKTKADMRKELRIEIEKEHKQKLDEKFKAWKDAEVQAVIDVREVRRIILVTPMPFNDETMEAYVNSLKKALRME